MPFSLERLAAPGQREGTGSSALPDGRGEFEGRVSEVLHGGSYSYFAVAGDTGEVRWVVSLHKDIPQGSAVRVRAFGKKSDFLSKKLDRRFPILWFGIVTPQEFVNETGAVRAPQGEEA